jgi:hypothetical protein
MFSSLDAPAQGGGIKGGEHQVAPVYQAHPAGVFIPESVAKLFEIEVGIELLGEDLTAC